MLRRLGGAASSVAVLVACGARTDPGLAGKAMLDSGVSHPPHAACESADGIRLCGSGCPELPSPDCPGWGCTRAYDIRSFAPAEAGVCWSDAPDKSARHCPKCNADELCIQRAPDNIVCTSTYVCEALWDLGVRDVCRFTDGSAYDGKAIADGGACPHKSVYGLCGGSCASCGLGDVYCVGRSSSHPFGLCMRNTYDANISHCDWPCGSQANSCAVMSVASGDHGAARRFGVCIDVASCAALAPFVVGGMSCEPP